VNSPKSYHLNARANVDPLLLLQIRDDGYLKQRIERQLVAAISHKVMEVATVTTPALDPKTGNTYVDLDVYVFTPTQFRRIVMDEAQRIYDRAMRGPDHNQY
jgi:hypothetical protein